MTKIKFDYSGLSRSVVPALDRAIANFNNARNSISGARIPSDCAYISYLRSINGKLSSMSQSCSQTKSWIQNSNQNYDGVLSTIEKNINSLEVVKIERK